ncbi:hypothetical protein OH492_27590 [Vibrio chagasii]|nr:hypothetical protein [Vibrio chagasii]
MDQMTASANEVSNISAMFDRATEQDAQQINDKPREGTTSNFRNNYPVFLIEQTSSSGPA